ncbi:MAG TPA: VWA domain-containing protein [Terriglobales bacterium]|nr:VWA domain-containing protein [Terriglobales bacterium]
MGLLSICVSAVLATSIFAQAQTMSATGASSPEFLAPAATISKTVDEVNLAFTVTDSRGHFISDLGANDFRLLDNRQAPRRLTFFQQRSDLPLHLAILIDASSSVQYRFRFEQDAAVSFLNRLLRREIDRALVVAFNDSVETVQEPTDRIGRLKRSLRRLKPQGNTALYDAVIYACQRLREIPEDQITRRAIIVISDGVDTAGRSTLRQAEQAAARSEVVVFALSTNYSGEDTNGQGDPVLENLALSSGGTMLRASDESRLSSAFRQVQRALRNQYVVAYQPAGFSADGSYRTVEVIPLKQGLRTSCRKGYFARTTLTP